MKPQHIRIAILASVAGAFLLAALLAGYAIGKHPRYFPFLDRIERALIGSREGASGDAQGPQSKRIETIFFSLDTERGIVPVEREGFGGAITSFGDAVLLLANDGTIYSARSAATIKKTNIETPDNGFASYYELAQSKRYPNLLVDFIPFRYFRFNDILHYAADGRQGLAISYTEYNAQAECYGTAIATLELPAEVRKVEEIVAKKSDWTVIYRTRPCLSFKEQPRGIEGHMAGGRMAFQAPHTLYLGSGEYHWDGIYAPQSLAQDPGNDYGKVIAIDLATRAARIVSIGNRNMQGVTVDPQGQLWVLEHGIRGGDELNRIVEGANYGWPKETLGTLYNRLPVPNTLSYGRHDTFTAPTFAWLPSIGISSLTVIKNFDPVWDGDLLAATLKDQSLHRIRIKDQRVLFDERIPIGSRIRYAHMHTDGRIVLWTDNRELIFVSVSKKSYTADYIAAFMNKNGWDDGLQKRVMTTLDNCMQCHSIEAGNNTGAPSLYRIHGAKIAGSGFDRYSAALKAHDGTWSDETLKAFLKDPGAFAPGTPMPNPGIDDPVLLDRLVDLLKATASFPE